jgi:GrpB-like predicted nucleotidyltransferase (UPF0157 family)
VPTRVQRDTYAPPVPLFPVRRAAQYHLHLLDRADELDEHQRFRDQATRKPALAHEYVALKRQLVARYSKDRERYTNEKAQFIRAARGRHRVRL